MNDGQEITYAFDLRPAKSKPTIVGDSIPRIARLMALAIRFEGLLREGKIRDYAELARLGSVTRARITQIMRLRHLASDIQEQILFLPSTTNINERNLRPIVRNIDWERQRSMFGKLADPARDLSESKSPMLHDHGLTMPK